MWLAALAASQMQPNAALTPNDTGKQITGAGTTDQAVIPTNTLMLPKLFKPPAGVMFLL